MSAHAKMHTRNKTNKRTLIRIQSRKNRRRQIRIKYSPFYAIGLSNKKKENAVTMSLFVILHLDWPNLHTNYSIHHATYNKSIH